MFDSRRNMSFSRMWVIIFVLAAACTCGVRTECSKSAQISFLTSVHDDPSCTKVSAKGVMLYEAANLLAEIHSNKTDGHDIEITVLDTCGSITGAMKAIMKALVWADVNCLHPPYYLGIIGPDTMINTEAVHKVTSILQVPHIVKESAISPYLHHLAEESDSYLVQGILKMIDALNWKTFTLVVNVNDDHDDDVQNIAKQLTISAIAKNLCVIVHDDDSEDYTSHIVHIGKPEKKFLSEPINAAILIISEGSLKNYLARVNSNNIFLLLEDSRNFSDVLESRVENSRWWAPGDGFGKYDAENLRQVRWLENAVEIYVRALKATCKNKKCKSPINALDWNHVVSNILMTRNTEATPRYLQVSVKTKTSDLERLGNIIVRGNKATLHWSESNKREGDMKKTEKNRETPESVPNVLKEFINRDNEPRTGCAKDIKTAHETAGKEVLVSGMDDTEWWTTVCTVSGVVVAMFLVGILAVYIIYVNIRGPKSPKSKGQSDRNTSPRRSGSDRELPTTITTRNQRASRAPQRTDSNRSTVSEKSV